MRFHIFFRVVIFFYLSTAMGSRIKIKNPQFMHMITKVVVEQYTKQLFITLACQTIWIHISWFRRRKKMWKNQRMREYLIYLFRYTQYTVQTHAHAFGVSFWSREYLVSPSWLNWFEWIYYCCWFDTASIDLNNHSAVSLCAILFISLLFFPPAIFKMICVVLI